ncbi:hypothetical protein chiPu_0023935, partial [Chiloscyllium punctatum]|nr:hypothetical protein [Chiloscyllium punctatum]
MPEYLQDPSVLTKERLKSELIAHSVQLPLGDQRKDVYVQLYLRHLTARNSGRGADFSSDEEADTGVGAAAAARGRGRAGRVRKAPSGEARLGSARFMGQPFPPSSRLVLGNPSSESESGANLI